MTNFWNQADDKLSEQLIMVIGKNVATVQRVSRYCLGHGIEVLPYYGFPTAEELTWFNPKVLVLCLPLPEAVWQQRLNRLHILWSEQPVSHDLPVASTKDELATKLQEVLQL